MVHMLMFVIDRLCWRSIS